ncbi:E3 ubiquitin ligase TRAF3IP2 [Eucyclogobius newberryi]|uniref:E3 ubiquitin ligase TRAF3IP2 n=1 Tax=Eucyclogobius newberryi TaxID=166745 RepID=UPI003B58C6CA
MLGATATGTRRCSEDEQFIPHPSIPVEMDENQDMAEMHTQEPLRALASEFPRLPIWKEPLYDPRHLLPSPEGSLEAPGPLRSEMSLAQCFPDAPAPGGTQCPRRLPQPAPASQVPQSSPQVTSGVMREVYCDPCPLPVDPGQIRRTINLPEECKTVFITYSVDTAKDMIPFTKFLLANGFQPAIDIFDSPIRSMDTTKWMDRFLNDKSVLIIVVISPQYKEDVEGHGPDEHCLHTKYIHKQIQNEFIQQGCLNFRLVPVLFPGASMIHVPSWLQSTKLYRWPQDGPDLLLRLFRMERYIVPLPGNGLTLSVRPL